MLHNILEMVGASPQVHHNMLKVIDTTPQRHGEMQETTDTARQINAYTQGNETPYYQLHVQMHTK